MTTNVIFVCLGNICRSPMAEAVFQRMVEEAGLSRQIAIDSAATSSYHVGERAHPGTRRVLAHHGITYDKRARQIRSDDLADRASYIVAMDQDGVSELRRTFGEDLQIVRLLDFADHTEVHDVPDPYYGDNFDHVYRLVEDGCRGLLTHIRREQGI